MGGTSQEPNRQYLESIFKTCASCAAAVMHHITGSVDEAWSCVVDAQVEAGVALAMYVSDAERRSKSRAVAVNAGGSRGKRNEGLKKFVLEQYATGSYKNPNSGGVKIAERFLGKNGEPPELSFKSYDSGLSIDNLEKTFIEWIRGTQPKKRPVSK